MSGKMTLQKEIEKILEDFEGKFTEARYRVTARQILKCVRKRIPKKEKWNLTKEFGICKGRNEVIVEIIKKLKGAKNGRSRY